MWMKSCSKSCVHCAQRSHSAPGVPPYVVFSNATLADMAARQPKSEYELLGVRGVGEAKARRYGAEFVDCIRDYLEEN